jgi:hypothetical protein
MNTQTGQIYRNREEARAAMRRGEPVVPISEEVAKLVDDGHTFQNSLSRKKQARIRNKAARRARKRNR